MKVSWIGSAMIITEPPPALLAQFAAAISDVNKGWPMDVVITIAVRNERAL